MALSLLDLWRAIEQDSAPVRATGINHVSIAATDLDESTRFYEEVLGLERIPTPDFAQPVQWLRVGEMQLHLLPRRRAAPPRATTSGSRSTTSTPPTRR